MPALGQCHRPSGLTVAPSYKATPQLAGGLLWESPGCSSPALAHADLITGMLFLLFLLTWVEIALGQVESPGTSEVSLGPAG